MIVLVIDKDYASPSKEKVSRQLPFTLTDQWPPSSPFNGCKLLPGASISAGWLATFNAVRSFRSLVACGGGIPALEPGPAKDFGPSWRKLRIARIVDRHTIQP